MAGISLQDKIFYGPVFSRRFGRSYGINLLPTQYKLCSFDCVYCEYGRGGYQDRSLFFNDDMPKAGEIIEEVEKALRKPRSVQSLTFSGNGEPTLHPDFYDIVLEVKNLRDHFCPNSQLVLLSNASQLFNPEIVKAINLFDIPMMKLDAGDERTYKLINHPEDTVHLNDILDGLKRLPHLMVQSMIIDGQITNSRGEPYAAWVEALNDLRPEKVQIYSADRPPADTKVEPVSPQKLKIIQKNLREISNLDVDAFWTH